MSHKDAIHEEEYKGLNIYIIPDIDPAINPVEDYDMLGTQMYWHRRYSLGHCPDVTRKYSPEEWLLSEVMENCWKHIEQTEKYEKWADTQEEDGYDYDVDTYIENEMSFEELMEAFEKYNIVIPVHAYEHGGITISASGRRAGWDSFDSGQLGFVYVSNKDIYKEYNVTSITPEIREKAEKRLVAEVEEYDSYLRGEVYGFIIEDENDEELESVWGFLGDYKYCLAEAKSSADWWAGKKEEELKLYD